MPIPILPPGCTSVRFVDSFDALLHTPFGDGVNALCWPRDLVGDFAEVVSALGREEGMDSIDEAALRSLTLSAGGRAAVEVLLEDLRCLREQGLEPLLDCITAYPRDDDPDGLSTDVYSWHADSATTEADTWLCTYSGPSSEGLRNEEAVAQINLPDVRARLLALHGGPDDEEFQTFLQENCYDLHYAALPGAVPYVFGLGNLWRIAVQHDGSPVPPCIHRAPENIPGQPPRLLLIS